MTQQVFIRVVGFTDVERHALNTVFRLSQDREPAYALWEPGAPEPARLALLDGDDGESRPQAAVLSAAGVHVVWVGDGAPENTSRVFHRPLAWPQVLQAMDQLLVAADLDFDLFGEEERGGPDTVPSQFEEEESGKRALIASGDLNERLYLRAKLALAHMPVADEAVSAAQVLELLRSNSYAVALIDFNLPGAQGWSLVKQLKIGEHPVANVIVTKHDATFAQKIRGRMAGATAIFRVPRDPEQLGALLERVHI